MICKHSADGALVAGGFSDSSIKLWNVVEQRFRSDKTDGANDDDDDVSNTAFRKLIGHAGPVYALAFSVDSKVTLCFSFE